MKGGGGAGGLRRADRSLTRRAPARRAWDPSTRRRRAQSRGHGEGSHEGSMCEGNAPLKVESSLASTRHPPHLFPGPLTGSPPPKLHHGSFTTGLVVPPSGGGRPGGGRGVPSGHP